MPPEPAHAPPAVTGCGTLVPSSSPLWDTIHDDILCPLCQYNLRGLTEPRCPECGYRFDWSEVLDPNRRRHPYLFEQHPTPRGFVRTALAALWPRTFWTRVNPAQPPRAGRLFIYWLLMTLPAFAAALGMFAAACYEEANQQRLIYLALMSAPGKPPNMTFIVPPKGGFSNRSVSMPWAWPKTPAGMTRAWIDATFPKKGVLESIADVWNTPYYGSSRLTFGQWTLEGITLVLGLLVLWPWATYRSLAALVLSMKKKGIERAHVLRCVVYSCDAALLLTMACLASGAWIVYQRVFGPAMAQPMLVRSWVSWSAGWLAPCMWLLWIVFTVRLAVAYRKYMRFDHPGTTVALTQFTLLLLFVVVFSQTDWFYDRYLQWLNDAFRWFRQLRG